jgi:hypothetical protein
MDEVLVQLFLFGLFSQIILVGLTPRCLPGIHMGWHHLEHNIRSLIEDTSRCWEFVDGAGREGHQLLAQIVPR